MSRRLTLPAGATRAVCPVLRRVEFPGKRRLRRYLTIPTDGFALVRFPEGMTLRLDLSESIQRDFYAGLHDAFELSLVRRLLRDGGDFVDVGAHVGLYTVPAARMLRRRARVLALEPNPAALAQLRANVALNDCANVVVRAAAASSRVGEARLAVPRTSDPSFSTLGAAAFDEGEPLVVETTTVDDEVVAQGLAPSLVKIDAENHELEVLAGMERTLALRPGVLCEVGPSSAQTIEEGFRSRSYRAFHVGRRRLHPGPIGGRPGYFNALFIPLERLSMLGRR